MGFGEQGGPVVVEAVEPPTRFSFRWNHPAGEEPTPSNSLLVEFTLAPEGEHTRLRVSESALGLDRPPRHRQAAVRRRAQPRLGRLPRPPRPAARRAARRGATRCGPSRTTTCGRRSPTPLAVGCSISSSSGGEATASSLADQVPFTRQAVSKHLVVLEEAGLIGRRKQGREVLFRVDADRLDQATQAMAEVARRWDQRLAAIKRLAEAAHAEAQRASTAARALGDHEPRALGLDRARRLNHHNRSRKEPTMHTPPIVTARRVGGRPPPPPRQGEGADQGPRRDGRRAPPDAVDGGRQGLRVRGTVRSAPASSTCSRAASS